MKAKMAVAKNSLKAGIFIDVISQNIGLLVDKIKKESVQQTVSNKKNSNINIKHGMNEKTSNKNTGLVDYKELENNILSSIRGR